MDLFPLYLSFILALSTSLILLFLCIPAAWLISRRRGFGVAVIESILSLPLVLPPTVLGFYILLFFSPNNALGAFLKSAFDLQVVFSFKGLLLGSVIYSLPFMLNPLIGAFRAFPSSLEEAASVLGKGHLDILLNILIPNIRPAVLTGSILAFAHTLGEFGVVLMIGGNIPGRTRVASIAIYEEVELLNYSNAHFYSLVLILVSFLVLLLIHYLNKDRKGRVLIS